MVLPQNIVIVEDEVVTQRALQAILVEFNVNIAGFFDNALDTLDALKVIDCDMLLLDIDINGAMDGIQLARHILRDRSIPIVFITSHDDAQTVEEVLELAPYGFISKPFSSKDIIVTIQIAYKRFLTHLEVFYTAQDTQRRDLIIDDVYTYSTQLSELYKNGVMIKLNYKQSKLLGILARDVNHTVSYDSLVEELWGTDNVSASGLRTLVYSLRKIVPELNLLSYSKLGYMLQVKSIL